MPRNEFNAYRCEPCREGEHWRCSEPGVCRCTVNPDTGIDEGIPGEGEYEDLSQEVPPIEEDPQPTTLADLRRGPGATTTEAHIAEINRESAATD